MEDRPLLKQEISGIDVCIFPSVTCAAEHIMSNGLTGFCNAIAINPEKIMRMDKDQCLKSVIEKASIKFPDGIGVCMAIARYTSQKVTRIPGCELWEELMFRAAEQGVPVFILGGTQPVNVMTVEKLRKKIGVEVVGSHDGFFDCDQLMVEKIRNSGARIVTVAMGSPKQELFIEKCRNAGLKGVFIGVGGTYDVFTGSNKRAPALLRKLGLEWFYRLVLQPQRILRQSNLLKFAILVLQKKI